ncbi:hypothetical protein NPX13_g6824 [Xylaria arbuscula]|uniref:Uncharacterized protein n=1 Tax=Xylaria arbuscula TaxID=114810 RepID=A0A9W8TLD3_9PEZI|nr:hypothetical protein NPX13_g6824 [Xylaria arbuscula]
MATPEPQSCSYRASWMFTDPYAYQYSDVDNEAPDVPPAELIGTGVYIPCELEGSSPLHYELPAQPSTSLALNRTNLPADDEATKAPNELNRARPSSTRSSVRSSNRRDLFRSLSAHKVPAVFSSRSCPAQPTTLGLIPVIEDTPTHTQRYYASPPTVPTRQVRPSPPGYADGLIPVDPNATTPKEPSSDFDAILRNIGPIPKKGKGNKSRERGNRYYDRYSSNFG